MSPFLTTLFAPKAPEPSYPVLPEAGAHGECSVPGVYVAGEVAGTPLLRLGMNAGVDLIDHLRPAIEAERAAEPAEGVLDVLIVGAGAAGLAAAVRAKEVGLSAVTLEANRFAQTVRDMTKHKLLLAEPAGVTNKSKLWFEECTKEQLLERWEKDLAPLGIDLREHERVVDLRRRGAILEVTSARGSYRARRVILALGKAGNPRKANVPGELEHAAKIGHRLIDPDDFSGKKILVYGGGDVALEAAVALARGENNDVTLATIDKEFVYPKQRNIDALRAAKNVRVLMDTRLSEIGASSVKVSGGGGKSSEAIANDFVFEMIGAELPAPFFKKIGVRLDNAWSWGRWVALAAIFFGVYSLYSLKSYGKGLSAWPFESLIAPSAYDRVLGAIFQVVFLPFAWMFSPPALADIAADRGYQQGFLYSGLYTVVMLVFGWEALMRWRRTAKNPRYQTYRYISLLAFQLVFFFAVNIVAVQALSVKYAWRAWGLYQPFPLFFNTFFWWYDGDPRAIVYFFSGAGIFGTLIAIPILSRNHGKRFCTWVCGCGGLAETLGDRWRHLAAKGRRSRAWEFQGTAILAASVIVLLVVVGMYETDGNNAWWRAYNYLVDFWLVAIIPIALYPFFGGKVWCRYWCPLAAYNQLLARWYGRLQIRSNDKCISCTQCSKYCQVGVDVMAFAKNQQAFDNKNSSCIHCGVCIDVCPVEVLSFSLRSHPALPIIDGKHS